MKKWKLPPVAFVASTIEPMTHPTQNNANPAMERNDNSNVDSWIQLSDCFLQAIQTLTKSNADTNQGDDNPQEKGDAERHHPALCVVWAGSLLVCEALGDPAAFVVRMMMPVMREALRFYPGKLASN